MAFIDYSQSPHFGSEAFYNVSQGVGPDVGGSYQRDDIMLVQYLLKKTWEQHGYDFTPQMPKTPDDTINVDGIYGPITARWILQFQQSQVDQGKNVVVDGRVDTQHDLTTPIHQALWTISILNGMFHYMEPKLFYDPTQDTDCPADLINSLVQSMSGGSGGATSFPLPAWGSDSEYGSSTGGGG